MKKYKWKGDFFIIRGTDLRARFLQNADKAGFIDFRELASPAGKYYFRTHRVNKKRVADIMRDI
ncbi:unnamed protein product [marine sediment metagenome]|uniref:Uncharacterized protein n=1 Tax=marine sediment metagenome TaxID=412755 RepID=X1ITE5_9ZZZZ